MITTVLANLTDTGSLGLFVGIGYGALWIAPFITILLIRRRLLFPLVFVWWYVWAGMKISCGATSVAFNEYNHELARINGIGSIWNGQIAYERSRGKLSIDQVIEFPREFVKVRAPLPIPDPVSVRLASDYAMIFSMLITGVWLVVPRVQLARLEKWAANRLRPRVRQ